MFNSLEFVIHLGKSVFILSQLIDYLAFDINLVDSFIDKIEAEVIGWKHKVNIKSKHKVVI